MPPSTHTTYMGGEGKIPPLRGPTRILCPGEIQRRGTNPGWISIHLGRRFFHPLLFGERESCRGADNHPLLLQSLSPEAEFLESSIRYERDRSNSLIGPFPIPSLPGSFPIEW